MLAQSTSVFTEGARKTKTEQVHHHKSNQDESRDEEHGRWDQIRPEMIDPSAGNRWGGKQHGSDAGDACGPTPPGRRTSAPAKAESI